MRDHSVEQQENPYRRRQDLRRNRLRYGIQCPTLRAFPKPASFAKRLKFPPAPMLLSRSPRWLLVRRRSSIKSVSRGMLMSEIAENGPSTASGVVVARASLSAAIPSPAYPSTLISTVPEEDAASSSRDALSISALLGISSRGNSSKTSFSWVVEIDGHRRLPLSQRIGRARCQLNIKRVHYPTRLDSIAKQTSVGPSHIVD